MADFKYGIFDAQIILVTHLHFLKARNSLTQQELVKKFIQTIAKCTREYCDCDKVILAWDGWPYHRSKLLDAHKGDRYYANEQAVIDYQEIEPISEEEQKNYILALINENQGKETWEIDEIVNEWKLLHPTYQQHKEHLEWLRKEAKANNIKHEAKEFIINTLGEIGFPSMRFKGYEADDLAYICATLLSGDDKPSYICSKDSDWRYLINPNVELMRYHKGTMELFKDVYLEVPENLRRRGVGLYVYKAIIDSLHGSHNNLYACRKDTFGSVTLEQIYDWIDKKDIDSLENICDTDVFLPQLRSFDVTQFEDYNEVLPQIKDLLFSNDFGKLMDDESFSKFAETNSLGISTKYYSQFKGTLNQNLYGQSSYKKLDIDALFDSI